MKRQYITDFTWEDYKPWDRLIYDGVTYSYYQTNEFFLCYGTNLLTYTFNKKAPVVIFVELDEKRISSVRSNISLSEIKIERDSGILVQLYHYIIDLWN